MLKLKPLILDNQRWVIRDGGQVQALDNEWVPGHCRLRSLLLPHDHDYIQVGTATQCSLADMSTVPPLMVVDLTISNMTGKQWNVPMLRELWPPDIVQAIR